MKINEKNLCVFARTPPFDMEGFLNKRGVGNKAFQQRYFVLKGNLLFYFESRTDKEPLGLVIVEGCTISLTIEAAYNYCFEIAFDGNRTYILAAESQDDMEAWMKALTCAGYEYKRIIVAELQRQLQEIENSKYLVRSAPDVNAPGKLRPAPMRPNPFDRPKLTSEQEEIPSLPFATGHFGPTSATAQQGQKPLDPRPAPRPPHPSSSVFYGPTPIVPARSKPIRANNNPQVDKDRENRLAKISEEFRIKHEQFRKDLMPEIIAYQRKRNQPLIEL